MSDYSSQQPTDQPEPSQHPMDQPEQSATQSLSDAEVAERLSAAFGTFRTAQHGVFHPPDLGNVYAIAQRRQHRRMILNGFAAAAALALVVGSATLMNFGGLGDDHPTAGEGAKNATSALSPSADPSRAPRVRKSPKPGRPNPAGVGVRDVRNATVQVPGMSANGCAGGTLEFSEGHASDPGGCVWQIASGAVRHTNLDGTPGAEVITTIGSGQPNTEHTVGVIALQVPSRDPATPLPSMGYVMTCKNSAQSVQGISVTMDGLISVGLQDSSSSPGTPQQQTRSYRWTASAKAFVQVSGPSVFPDPGAHPSGPGPDPDPSSPSPSPQGAEESGE
ncbi:MAG: hypothetical protein ACRDTQ_05540 [Micromonosporaceae bacterium]